MLITKFGASVNDLPEVDQPMQPVKAVRSYRLKDHDQPGVETWIVERGEVQCVDFYRGRPTWKAPGVAC